MTLDNGPVVFPFEDEFGTLWTYERPGDRARPYTPRQSDRWGATVPTSRVTSPEGLALIEEIIAGIARENAAWAELGKEPTDSRRVYVTPAQYETMRGDYGYPARIAGVEIRCRDPKS